MFYMYYMIDKPFMGITVMAEGQAVGASLLVDLSWEE